MLAALVALVAVATAVGAVPAQAGPMPNGVPGSWALALNEEFTANGLNKALWTPEWPGRGDVGGVHLAEPRVPTWNWVPVSTGTGAGKHVQWHYKNADTGSLIESNPADGQPGHSGFQAHLRVCGWCAASPGLHPKGLACPKGGCLPDWPGLWSLSNTNSNNEIDTMEGLNALGEECYHIHPPPGSEGPGGCLSGEYAGAWYTFGSEWEPGVVKVFYDGAQGGRSQTGGNQWNAAVPPHGHGAPRRQTTAVVVPDEMTVDYVRVWQHPGTAADGEHRLGYKRAAGPSHLPNVPA